MEGKSGGHNSVPVGVFPLAADASYRLSLGVILLEARFSGMSSCKVSGTGKGLLDRFHPVVRGLILGLNARQGTGDGL